MNRKPAQCERTDCGNQNPKKFAHGKCRLCNELDRRRKDRQPLSRKDYIDALQSSTPDGPQIAVAQTVCLMRTVNDRQ